MNWHDPVWEPEKVAAWRGLWDRASEEQRKKVNEALIEARDSRFKMINDLGPEKKYEELITLGVVIIGDALMRKIDSILLHHEKKEKT